MNKEIIDKLRLKDINDFKDLYNELNKYYVTYLSDIVSNSFEIPSMLKINIDYWDKFKCTFDKLVKKLYIWVYKGYSLEKMFYQYILPTSVFLHYMHVNIDNINEINVYIVNSEIYGLYRENIGGEYVDGFNPKTKLKTHLILVKDYLDREKDHYSLCSLFHELTHLIDNIDFKNYLYGYSNPYIIDYTYRWHEIKARVLSEFFYGFYNVLNKAFDFYDKLDLLNKIIPIATRDLDGLYHSIVNIIECNSCLIELDFDFDHIDKTTRNYTHQNIQYYESLKQISQLCKFFNQMEGVLEK